MRTLSQADKSVLIWSVASALHAYTLNKCLLPKTLCYCIDSMFMRFWWDFCDNGQRHLFPQVIGVYLSTQSSWWSWAQAYVGS